MIYSLNGVRTTRYSFGKDNKVKLLVETKTNSRWIKYVNKKTKRNYWNIVRYWNIVGEHFLIFEGPKGIFKTWQ